MESKLKNTIPSSSKVLFAIALLALLIHIALSSLLSGFFHNFSQVLGRNISNGFVTFAIKFLHFFMAKCLQFRYAWTLQPARSTMSWLFWVVFTRSISSMPDYPF